MATKKQLEQPEVLPVGKRLQVFSIKSDANGATMWVKAGSAWVNRDGSMNVYLDMLPLDGRLHIREALSTISEADEVNKRAIRFGALEERHRADRCSSADYAELRILTQDMSVLLGPETLVQARRDAVARGGSFIAAAPDLLAALEALVEHESPLMKVGAVGERWGAAVTAIARARGGK